MIELRKLFLFAVWVTLVIWAVVEYNYAEKHTVAPTIVVTPLSGD